LRNGWTIIGIAIIGSVFITLFVETAVFGTGENAVADLDIVQYALLLVLVGIGVALGWRLSASSALRMALGCSAIVAIGLIVYSADPSVEPKYLAPAAAKSTQTAGTYEWGVVHLTAESTGHFFATGQVEGTDIDFIVDTGATLVALTYDDALNIGLPVHSLRFDASIKTANGQTWGAIVELADVTIGEITVRNVQAMVLDDGLDRSLLGMSFLNRLTSFEIARDKLTLRQ